MKLNCPKCGSTELLLEHVGAHFGVLRPYEFWPISEFQELIQFFPSAEEPIILDMRQSTAAEVKDCGKYVKSKFSKVAQGEVPPNAAAEKSLSTPPQWRDVQVELPEYDTDVLLWAEGWKHVHVGYWRHSHEWIGRYRPESTEPLPDTNPTHWQPLPEPPEG